MSTLVIGAGMAGLAAARILQDSGETVTVLEAKNRIGGRTHTSRSFASHPVELGAEFIHGDRAATWELVKELGLRTLHWTKLDDSLVRLETGELLTMREARASHPEFDITRSWQLPDVDPLPFEDWHSYLRRIGFDQTQLRYVKRSFANACGESMRFISARAALTSIRTFASENGNGDYRILGGYDQLVNHLATGLNIHLDDPIVAIDWQPGNVQVTTLDGAVYCANSCIVAIPLGVLQASTIEFNPALPESKTSALLGLRMGPVIKLIYRFSHPITPPHIMALYSRHNPPMWWSPSFGHQADETVWTAFVSGDWCIELLNQGQEGALLQGLAALKQELGVSELPVTDMHLENWPDDPYTRGGYSFVLVGQDGAREKLAAPTPPLFWAGEASAPEQLAATVHGAYLSGMRAAQEALSYQHDRLITPIATQLPAVNLDSHSNPEKPAVTAEMPLMQAKES
jgi:monoamine oxidase